MKELAVIFREVTTADNGVDVEIRFKVVSKGVQHKNNADSELLFLRENPFDNLSSSV